VKKRNLSEDGEPTRVRNLTRVYLNLICGGFGFAGRSNESRLEYVISGNMPPPRLFSLAYISPQNHPILVRTFAIDEEGKRSQADVLKAYYIAHTSLDVFDERRVSL
jgi:hypothetical protein